jgi:hypothetical protein
MVTPQLPSQFQKRLSKSLGQSGRNYSFLASLFELQMFMDDFWNRIMEHGNFIMQWSISGWILLPSGDNSMH